MSMQVTAVIDPLAGHDLQFLVMFYIPKLAVALFCGGIIGLEREFKKKTAGLKTLILFCSGVTILTATAFLLASGMTGGDPLRIVGQIVSGVGFLGAGVIFKSGGKVSGVTTSAVIWALCAIGIVIGAGGLVIAMIMSVCLLVLLIALSRFESEVLRPPRVEDNRY